MESKIKIILLNKKDPKLKNKIPTQKRLTHTQSSKKIALKKTSKSKNQSKIDSDTISTRKTTDSLFTNKKNNNTNMNFVYKKNINRPKISIKVIKNKKFDNNNQTDKERKTLAHSSSSGYLKRIIKTNNNNKYYKNYDFDNNYFNIENNDNWIHSPKKNHLKLFTENIQELKPHLNANIRNKIKEINIKSITNLETYNDNKDNFINNNINGKIHSPKNKNKKIEIINIEDLLLLDENFIEVINSIPINFNISNNCFEFFNIYINSSLNSNFKKYFNDYQSNIIIIHTSIMIMLFNIILLYHLSFTPQFLYSCNALLKNLIILSHKSFLLICQLISNVVSSSAKENIWVKKLRKMLEENIVHPDNNNQEFNTFLSTRNLQLVNNTKYDSLIEIKFYTYLIKNQMKLLLNIINDKDPLKNEFCNLFKNIDNLSFNCLNKFYISKVLRIINKNASVTGKNASSYGGMMVIYNIKVPYLTNINNKKFTLVLDLDETLIAFKINPNQQNNGILKFRPYLDYFLAKMKKIYEIVVFTSATQEYADPIENNIEQNQKGKYFNARLYRQHTIIYENDFVKDISRIGRPLSSIIIVDNMPQNFRLQKENGIFIKPFWGDDDYDTALYSLADILENIHNQFDDIRKGIFFYKDEILNKVTSNFSKKKI